MTGARPRVLVTRPEPGATATARRLDALGFEPLVLPLQEIRPLAVDPAAIPPSAAAVAISSSNAVRHAPAPLIAGLAGLPCFAVGEATAKAAGRAGFASIAVADGDGGALADMLTARRPNGAVVYLCGKVRRPQFERRLAQEGIEIAAVETYDTLLLRRDAPTLLSAAGGQPIDGALVYSANAAQALAELMAEPGISPLFRNTSLVCMAPRVAEVFAGLPQKIALAAEPNEAALLHALELVVKPTP